MLDHNGSFGFSEFFGSPGKLAKPQGIKTPANRPRQIQSPRVFTSGSPKPTQPPQAVRSENSKTPRVVTPESLKPNVKKGGKGGHTSGRVRKQAEKTKQTTCAKASKQGVRKKSLSRKKKLCSPATYYCWNYTLGNTYTFSDQTKPNTPSSRREDEQEYPVCILARLSQAAPSPVHHVVSNEPCDSIPADVLIR